VAALEHARAGARRYATLLALPGARRPVIASAVGAMPIGMFGLAILLLAQDTTGSFAVAGRVVGAFGIGNAVGAVAQGRMMDRLGQTRVLRVAALVHAVACGVLVLAALDGARTAVLYACAAAGGLALPQLPAAMRSLWSTLARDQSQRETAYAMVSIVFEVSVNRHGRQRPGGSSVDAGEVVRRGGLRAERDVFPHRQRSRAACSSTIRRCTSVNGGDSPRSSAAAAWSSVRPVPVRIEPTSGGTSAPQTPVSQPSATTTHANARKGSDPFLAGANFPLVGLCQVVPRTPRIELEGGIHHLTARGDHREAIFDGEADRVAFLRRYKTVVARHGWIPITYCLMDNHVHIVIETPRLTLGDGARDLLSEYAAKRNRRRCETGHIFQGRFGSRLVGSPEYFAQLLRYVALNPVVAGACSNPREWQWSSHRALLAGHGDPLATPRRVAELLEVWGGRPEDRYGRLFEQAHPLEARYGMADPATWRPPLAELLESGMNDGLAAARSAGYLLREIAAHLGVNESTVSRRLARKKGV
jgi:REP element-mobilizing transposase RayT